MRYLSVGLAPGMSRALSSGSNLAQDCHRRQATNLHCLWAGLAPLLTDVYLGGSKTRSTRIQKSTGAGQRAAQYDNRGHTLTTTVVKNELEVALQCGARWA